MSAGGFKGLVPEPRDLPPGWHLKAVPILVALVLAAVFLVWKSTSAF
ncbi:MAG TPA: hypothetical protein VNZ54_02880 [bacterium]|nr:hypothetical protein [bacterium]